MRPVTADAERKFRAACADQGIPPNPSIIAKMRSGEFERQSQEAKQRNQEHIAYLARLRRQGYSFDIEHRLVAPALTRIHVAPRRANPERRPAARRSARASTSDDPSPEPDPPPVEHWRGVAAASVRMVQHCERRRAKWAAA